LRLPRCCRPHGAHRCAMTMQMAPQAASDKPLLVAPARCPWFPDLAATPATPVYAIAVSPVSLSDPLKLAYSSAASRASARWSKIRTRAGRGPPAPTPSLG
jgi:hypothetical protein